MVEATARRPHRRASQGFKVRAQVMITPDTAADIRTLADLREVSEGEIIRAALAEYVPDALKRAKWTLAKRGERTGMRHNATNHLPYGKKGNTMKSKLTLSPEISQALKGLQDRLTLSPETSRALKRLQDRLTLSPEISQALKGLQDRLTLSPETSQALKRLQDRLTLSPEMSQALKGLQDRLTLSPEMSQALRGLQDKLKEVQVTPETQRVIQELLSDDPGGINQLTQTLLALQAQATIDQK